MVAYCTVRAWVSVTLGRARQAQTRENVRLPKGIAVLTELVTYYYYVTNYPKTYSLKTNIYFLDLYTYIVGQESKHRLAGSAGPGSLIRQ